MKVDNFNFNVPTIHDLSPKIQPVFFSVGFPGTSCVSADSSHPGLMLLVYHFPERADIL